jgi:predicted nucleic acid-binding protein
MPGSFFDTNVLLYVASGDPAKADRAEMLVGAGGIVLDGRLRVANPFRAP